MTRYIYGRHTFVSHKRLVEINHTFYYKEILDQIENLKKQLAVSIAQFDAINVEKNKELEIKLEEKYKQDKEQLSGQYKEEIKKIKEEKDDLLRRKESEISAVRQELALLRDGKKKFLDELEEFGKKIESLKQEKSELKKQLTEKTRQYKKEIKELTDKAEKLQLKNERLEKVEDTNKELKEKNEAYIEAWGGRLKPYEDVLQSMQHCHFFKELLEKKKIRGNDEDQLFLLALCIGKTLDFAVSVYERAKEVKQGQKEPMTTEEAEVYSNLNKCYRHIMGISTDVFVLPGGQSFQSEYQKQPFDKKTMENLDNPRTNTLKYAQQVYVPMLNNFKGDMYRQAEVKAGNL